MAESVLATKRTGWLRVHEPRPGAPVMLASLVDEHGRNLLTGLTNVTLRKIERGGVLIAGFADNGRSATAIRQSWWCVPRLEQRNAKL